MKKTLEQLCPYADRCAVDYTKSETCREYINCKIYQELIKYDKKYLKDKVKVQRSEAQE